MVLKIRTASKENCILAAKNQSTVQESLYTLNNYCTPEHRNSQPQQHKVHMSLRFWHTYQLSSSSLQFSSSITFTSSRSVLFERLSRSPHSLLGFCSFILTEDSMPAMTKFPISSALLLVSICEEHLMLSPVFVSTLCMIEDNSSVALLQLNCIWASRSFFKQLFSPSSFLILLNWLCRSAIIWNSCFSVMALMLLLISIPLRPESWLSTPVWISLCMFVPRMLLPLFILGCWFSISSLLTSSRSFRTSSSSGPTSSDAGSVSGPMAELSVESRPRSGSRAWSRCMTGAFPGTTIIQNARFHCKTWKTFKSSGKMHNILSKLELNT